MIAMKREVAARQMNKLVQVFRGANVKLGNWRQVTVRITTDYCLPIMGKGMKQRVSFSRHTRESVQSPLVVLKSKVRKGGDFFYGKSSNENHIESI